MEQITFSKRDIIQKEGRLSFYLYFVERGIVRSFISRENKDVTIYIVAEGDTSLDSVGLTEILNSKFSIEAIEDVVLWRIHKKQLKSLCSNSVVFANYYWMDKKEQYKLMLKRQPEIFQRISLKDIASYLNVTPQSLSRIRTLID